MVTVYHIFVAVSIDIVQKPFIIFLAKEQKFNEFARFLFTNYTSLCYTERVGIFKCP